MKRRNKAKAVRTAAAVIVLALLAGLMTSCKTAGNDVRDEVTIAPAAPTDAPSGDKVTAAPAPTDVPTEAITAEPTETPEPTEKPDYSGGIAKEKACSYQFFSRQGTEPLCGTGRRLAVQFYATVSFSKIGFHSPTWTAKSGYYVDYELYEWNRDYETTVFETEPVATGHLEDWEDGVMASLNVESLPAGEYVLLALYGSNEEMCNSGVWLDTDVEREDQISYLDDEIWYDHAIWLEIRYETTPNNKYGPLSDPGL